MINIDPVEVLALKKLALINKALADSLKDPGARREQIALLGVLVEIADRATLAVAARSQPQEGGLPRPLTDWLTERLHNCRRIADQKDGDDRGGWLEDARYFEAALAALGNTH